jgi:hypothetical protein
MSSESRSTLEKQLAFCSGKAEEAFYLARAASNSEFTTACLLLARSWLALRSHPPCRNSQIASTRISRTG